jgi:hypothetical protein
MEVRTEHLKVSVTFSRKELGKTFDSESIHQLF